MISICLPVFSSWFIASSTEISSLISADDAYKNSKRRLDAMRNSRSRCISDFLTNYVEGVIKELEKYPEEKLAD